MQSISASGVQRRTPWNGHRLLRGISAPFSFLRTPKNCCSLSSSTLIKRICQRTGHHGCRPRSTEKLEEMSKASRTVSQKRGRQTRRRRLPVERLCYVQTSRTKKDMSLSKQTTHSSFRKELQYFGTHALTTVVLAPLYVPALPRSLLGYAWVKGVC